MKEADDSSLVAENRGVTRPTRVTSHTGLLSTCPHLPATCRKRTVSAVSCDGTTWRLNCVEIQKWILPSSTFSYISVEEAQNFTSLPTEEGTLTKTQFAPVGDLRWASGLRILTFLMQAPKFQLF